MISKPLKWLGDSRIVFENGVALDLVAGDALHTSESTSECFVLGKGRSMVECLIERVGAEQPRRIVDLGIFKGGSVVLLNEVFQPEKLVAIELFDRYLDPLRDYIANKTPEGRIKIYPGINQANQARLNAICDEEFGTEPIDLVIDDASHFLHETRESFRAIFPRLRKGGLYVIEDWGWAHWEGDQWQRDGGGSYFGKKPPLTSLIMEMVLLAASSPRLVSNVWVERTVTYVCRGDQALDSGFEPSDFYLNRGVPVDFSSLFDGTKMALEQRGRGQSEENAQLKTSISELQATVSRLKQQLGTAKSEIKAAKRELTELQNVQHLPMVRFGRSLHKRLGQLKK